MLTSKFISARVPLFYYSFTQKRIKESGDYEIHAANKITIRKHFNYENDGLEILVYNCALNVVPELCEGIRQTDIVSEKNEEIRFFGKGISGNGIPLTNRFGTFFYRNNMPEYAFGLRDCKNIYIYRNFYKTYGDDVFVINEESVKEFLLTSRQLMDTTPIDTSIWVEIRCIVLSYYAKLYNWERNSLPFVYDMEWNSIDNIITPFDKIPILEMIEETCDEKVYDAYQDYRKGNEILFRKKIESMVSLLGTYYLLYRTLV